MAEQESIRFPSSLQEECPSSDACPFPDDLSWFYVLRQLCRRQMVAAHTFARQVACMERAMQPVIRARKRAHFSGRKVRRHIERRSAGQDGE